MTLGETIKDYCEEVGGVFHHDDIQAIPYNHWKQDCEWLVLVTHNKDYLFVPAHALTAREACDLAVQIYKLVKDTDKVEDDDE